VLALPLGARFTAQQITGRVWVGASAMVVGIVLFLAVGSPQGGVAAPTASAWWTAGLNSALVVAALALLGHFRRGATRALLLGSAAGVCYAMQASVTKVFVAIVGHGLVTLLTSWTIYVLIVSAVTGFIFQQSALKTGVLAPAMGSSNAVTLFVSVLLGTQVFGETLAEGGRRAPAILGLVVGMAGIALLAGAPPPNATASDAQVATTA
jgi:hypothetical protein